MDLIESIRQMMADENFSGAEQASESLLISIEPARRALLVELYLESLLHQKKSLPAHLVTEILNNVWEKNPEHAISLFESAGEEVMRSQDTRVLFFRMKLAEKRGHIQDLHDLISDFHLRIFERNVPHVPEFISNIIRKYFRTDFQLRLQGLALTMLRKDIAGAELVARELILEAFEKSSPKVLREKLTSMHKVLASQAEKGPLEIYDNFLGIYLNGFQEKKDFKRLAEAVIYFEDFRFNVMVMQILYRSQYHDMCADYARELSVHKNYDFVYIAKHFPELKKFFVTVTKSVPRAAVWETPDLTLEEEPVLSPLRPLASERSEDEQLLIQLVKGQEFSDLTLLELCVSFLQSELPRVAVSAGQIVHARTTDTKIKLKAAYLILTALLQSGDYRRAVDLALESMKLVHTTDDLLSFLYCEAEAYLRLNMKTEAQQVLRKILSIDSRYRMARERLEKLG